MKSVVILGGRGFLGSKIIEKIDKQKWRIFTFDRNGGDNYHIKGSISLQKDVEKAVSKKDAVINLIGLTPLRKPNGATYQEIHVGGALNVLNACEKNKIKNLIHISALGADENSDIEYLRTKGKAQKLLEQSKQKITVIRPSVIFDKESELIKSFSKNSWTRVFPKIKTQIQPIYLDDIARIIVKILNEKPKKQTLDIAGPQALTVYDMAKQIYKKRNRLLIPIPSFFFKFGVLVASIFHIKGLTMDQIKMLNLNNKTDNNSAGDFTKLTSFSSWIRKTNLSVS